ncbi:hypothetical protein NM208_g14384 [Fusarium decemcellulare]|uniref:Uncharacterized protein n=1 Tax=Fusarium decemcellulare TaxID=57161 RepID=A0ACC1RHG2_9HYPO|nr:hypothetical protein NM208_g14384 [Fusarium decemcellulare]
MGPPIPGPFPHVHVLLLSANLLEMVATARGMTTLDCPAPAVSKIATGGTGDVANTETERERGTAIIGSALWTGNGQRAALLGIQYTRKTAAIQIINPPLLPSIARRSALCRPLVPTPWICLGTENWRQNLRWAAAFTDPPPDDDDACL